MIQDLFQLPIPPGDKKIKKRMNNRRQKLIHRSTLTLKIHKTFRTQATDFELPNIGTLLRIGSAVEQRY